MHVVCRVDDIKPESGKEVCIEGEDGLVWLMLFARDREVLGYYNHCPHKGRALNWGPDRFLFGNDGLLICPHHGASFDLGNGRCVSGPCEGRYLQPVTTRVIDGEVCVDLPPAGRDGRCIQNKA